MKKTRSCKIFIEHLKKVPIIQVACEKTNISRNSIYRWRKEDLSFAKEMDEALTEGEMFICDMSETQLISLIKEKSFPAIRFWLKHRSPKFKERLEVISNTEDNPLTLEQEDIIREALKLSEIYYGQTYDSK